MAMVVRSWRSWSGLALAPAAWAIGTQVKYALVPWTCENQAWLMTLGVSLLTALVAAAAAFLSWREWQALPAESSPAAAAQTTRFLAALSALVGVLFMLAILLQGAAGLVFGGCET